MTRDLCWCLFTHTGAERSSQRILQRGVIQGFNWRNGAFPCNHFGKSISIILSKAWKIFSIKQCHFVQLAPAFKIWTNQRRVFYGYWKQCLSINIEIFDAKIKSKVEFFSSLRYFSRILFHLNNRIEKTKQMTSFLFIIRKRNINFITANKKVN